MITLHFLQTPITYT